MPAPNSPGVILRATCADDVPALFLQQLDAESNRMAGTKPRSEEAFRAIWERVLSDPTAAARVIVEGDVVVGSINCHKVNEQDNVGYWIDRRHWGRGIATRALSLYIQEISCRPLHASAARDNAASIRVLQRCGFRLTGYHTGEETDRYVAREIATFVLE